VDSVIVNLTPYDKMPFEVSDESFFVRMVRWLFTQRNKKLGNAIVPFLRVTRKIGKDEAERIACSFAFSDERVRALAPRDFGELANVLSD
jgi:16S rRNA A1518/A1519 N6-dimethyltransferase RsmA/KsgA/DIM1 with predicted DNA glycosylase/AP lyase activity